MWVSSEQNACGGFIDAVRCHTGMLFYLNIRPRPERALQKNIVFTLLALSVVKKGNISSNSDILNHTLPANLLLCMELSPSTSGGAVSLLSFCGSYVLGAAFVCVRVCGPNGAYTVSHIPKMWLSNSAGTKCVHPLIALVGHSNHKNSVEHSRCLSLL